MAERSTNGVDLALFEFHAGLLDGVRDRLRSRRRVKSTQAQFDLGSWAGMHVVIVCPSKGDEVSELLESVQLAHKPKATLGFEVFREAIAESQEGILFCLSDPMKSSDLLLDKLLKNLPSMSGAQSQHEFEAFSFIGVYVSDTTLFEQRTLSKRLGRQAGKLLKRPKELLRLPHKVSKRLTIQNEVANQLEVALKVTQLD